ncbi:maleylpyruvate isomerase N-terminal domain-containing protein [Nocardioides sp.]|uniref:maleylpyruvate isomerase N-terminal domain-containing protein n=1 Tax=Nocardioides sp. TaxID=35761 RepID=UPI002D7E26D0|nr:maleylpyruvate isomerase N-terminal domain-containing protein [Nocardioides sp.]HET8959583.1 maleylpyruvate isomerase N-terminal domain-containing protein [Nocardioides sp.]
MTADQPLAAVAYGALAAAVAAVDDDAAWFPTGCRGWCVRDLVHHLAADASRALVAVHSPAAAAPDCDSVAYWRGWGVDADRDELTRRATRIESGTRSWAALRSAYLETAAAAGRAVAGADPATVVSTQGHALTVADLGSTLAVEATLHHLDLIAHLPLPPPSPAGLREVRRVVEALLEHSLPEWNDERVALVATGRAAPTPDESTDLGPATDRLPVFS